MKTLSSHKSFGGRQNVYAHASEACGCEMRFAVYLPPQAEKGARAPALYWLSGLTCTEANVIEKAGAQRLAAALGVIVIAPDTSPRGPDHQGKDVPDDADGAYDLGLGAGFYVDATQDPWTAHYNMYSYVTEELPTLIEREFPVDPARCGVFGHSMGGHGALVIHLRNPKRFRTCSAFAPISNPSAVPWGDKALSAYLGDDRRAWAPYDAARLLADHGSTDAHILIDQGTDDQFLSEQLDPAAFLAAADEAGQAVTHRKQPGYDHSYYFIASFIDDHLRWHVNALG